MWRRIRFLAGILLGILLALLNLALGAYLLRDVVLEAPLRSIAESELSELLGADVELGDIEGDWVHRIRVDDISIRGRDGDAIREVRNLTVEAFLDPRVLMTGDLRGLLAIDVSAEFIDFDPKGRLPSTPPSEEESAPLPPLHELVPAGVRLRVDRLVFGGRPEEPLRLDVAPAPGSRTLELRTGRDLAATVDLDENGDLRASGAVRDLGSWLSLFGIETELRGGDVQFAADLQTQPFAARGRLSAEGFTAWGRGVDNSELEFLVDASRVSVPTGDLILPGVSASLRQVEIPFDTDLLATASGDVTLEIRDLSPYRELLPEPAREWLPLTGRTSLTMRDGEFTVHAGSFRGRGVAVEITEGQLQPDDGAVAGTLRCIATWEDRFEYPVTADDAVAAERGTVTAEIALRPFAARADVDLRDVVGFGFRAAEVRSTAMFEGAVLTLDDLTVAGASPTDVEAAAGVRGSGQVNFGEAGALSVSGNFDASINPGWVQWLTGPSDLLRPQPFDVAIQATADVDANGAVRGEATVGIPKLTVNELPPLALNVTANVDPKRFAVTQATITGIATLTATASGTLDGSEFEVALDRFECDQAHTVLEALAGVTTQGGAGTVDLEGSLQRQNGKLAANVAGDLSVDLPQPWRDAWPVPVLGPAPAGPVAGTCRVQLGDEPGVVDASLGWGDANAHGVTATIRGTLPQGLPGITGAADGQVEIQLRAALPGPPDQELALRLDTTASITRSTIEARTLSLRTGVGSLQGQAQLGGGSDWLLAPAKPVAIDGKLDLDRLDLATLPAEWLGLLAVAGSLDGSVAVAGSTIAPEPDVRLELNNGIVAVPGATRLTDLSAQIRATASEIVLESITASMGRGPLRLSGKLSRQQPFWLDAPPEATTVDVDLHAEEALLVNTSDLRVRANADLNVAGTLADVQVTGPVAITSGRFVKRLTLVPDLNMLGRIGGGGAGQRGIVPFTLPAPLGDAVHFDIPITTERPFQVRTGILNLDANVDLKMVGSGTLPYFQGNVSGSRGTLRFPGSRLGIESVLVTFREDSPLIPNLLFQARGRRYGFTTELVVTGPYDNPQALLSTQPPLPSADAWTLVTTGLPPNTLHSRGSSGQATLVGTYLAEELAGWYLGGEELEEGDTSFVDRFSFEAGTEVGEDGQEGAVLEFALSKKWHLQAERDIYGDYNGGLVLRLKLR